MEINQRLFIYCPTYETDLLEAINRIVMVCVHPLLQSGSLLQQTKVCLVGIIRCEMSPLWFLFYVFLFSISYVRTCFCIAINIQRMSLYPIASVLGGLVLRFKARSVNRTTSNSVTGQTFLSAIKHGLTTIIQLYSHDANHYRRR